MAPSKPQKLNSTPTNKQVVGGSLGVAAIISAALAIAVPSLKTDEGKRNVDYLDIARVPTACYGHTGPDVIVGKRRTDAQCESLLSADAQKHMQGVLKCVPGLGLRAYQLAAATRISFNIGVGGVCNGNIALRWNAGDWRGGCDAFLPWNKARVRGKLVVVPGLAARRQRERAVCLTGL